MPEGPGWTKHEDERLVELWRQHRSFAQISWEFPGRTRNACVGRLYRLRRRLGTDMVPDGKSVKPRGARKKRKRPTYSAKRRVVEAVPPTPIPVVAPPPDAIGKTLLEIGPRECRYIITGDAREHEHRYCALDASAFVDDHGNGCYCAYHRRVMRAGFRSP